MGDNDKAGRGRPIAGNIQTYLNAVEAAAKMEQKLDGEVEAVADVDVKTVRSMIGTLHEFEDRIRALEETCTDPWSTFRPQEINRRLVLNRPSQPMQTFDVGSDAARCGMLERSNGNRASFHNEQYREI